MGSYRKKGMERLQDSLLQDLERATTNLKNNPGNPGGWKLNRPPDHTITPTSPTYASLRKHYPTQYYLPEEPLYQNESIRRTNSNASSHDYAAVNGRHSNTIPRSPINATMHNEGRITTTTAIPRNRSASPARNTSPDHQHHHYHHHRARNSTELTDASDLISQKLSMLDSLLDDLNAARCGSGSAGPRVSPTSCDSRAHSAHSPTNGFSGGSSHSSLHRLPLHGIDKTHSSPVNGGSNHIVNGHSDRGRQYATDDRSDVQVNQLIKDLEFNLNTNDRTPINSKSKSVSFENAMPQPKTHTPSQTQSAQIQPVSEYNRNLVNIQAQKVRVDDNPVIQVPLGHSGPASNATRELDDLMASLSDFKMNQMAKGQSPAKSNLVALGRIQVPAKHGQVLYRPPNSLDLDSMIGNLESDLNQQGINTVAKGDCDSCGRPIVGQVVAAMGKIFHPEHFTCAKCYTELGNQAYFEREGLAYCEADYHRLYSPQCNHCMKPILDRCITALDKTWHPEHFFCAHCGKNFGDDGYHEKAGNAYCRDDFFKLFAPKCAGCANPIVDNFVTALGAQWHSDCFVCRDCKLPFNGDTFFDIEGHPYCETHYHDKRGTLCASCRQPITGRCITAMFQKYHPEHFTCSFCLKQLNKGTFKKHQEKPYCHSCFDKLFA